MRFLVIAHLLQQVPRYVLQKLMQLPKYALHPSTTLQGLKKIDQEGKGFITSKIGRMLLRLYFLLSMKRKSFCTRNRAPELDGFQFHGYKHGDIVKGADS